MNESIYTAPRKLTIHDFDNISFEDDGTKRFALASSVLRKNQFDSTNGFNYHGQWEKTRKSVILRDGPYDFITGRRIEGSIFVHHLNEINANTPYADIYDEDCLVPVSAKTHQSLHWAGGHQKKKHKESENLKRSWLGEK